MTTNTVPLMIEVTPGDANNDGTRESSSDGSIGDNYTVNWSTTSASSSNNGVHSMDLMEDVGLVVTGHRGRFYYCDCFQFDRNQTAPVPLHTWLLELPSSVRKKDVEETTLSYNRAKGLLDGITLFHTASPPASQSIVLSVKRNCRAVSTVVEHCMMVPMQQLECIRSSLHQFMIHGVSVEGYREAVDDIDLYRLEHKDQFINIAANFYLGGRKLCEMTRAREEEDINHKFVHELNGYLGEEDWLMHMHKCPFHAFENEDGTNRQPMECEVKRSIDYLLDKLFKDMMHEARFILNGYQHSYLSLAEARSARRSSRYGGARRLMSHDMINHTKVNAICVWEFSKDRLMKLAVRMAIAGNVLMMLARNRSDENDGWKCVTGERCVFDYEGNWFTHVDEFSSTCKVCGNDKQFNDLI